MRRALLVALLAGCYRPQDAACVIACETSAQCPGGLVCGAAGRCGADLAACASEPGDAALVADVTGDSVVPPPMDAGANCFTPQLGPSTALCVTSVVDVVLSGPISTDPNAPLCGGNSSATACVIEGRTVSVTANVQVSGTRALILLAQNAIDVNAAIDAASHLTQHAPGRSDACTTRGGLSGTTAAGSGGAGAGGQGLGGAGGQCQTNGLNGGATSPVVPLAFRGGCQGGLGGVVGANPLARGGGGGGAVYLISRTIAISTNGSINASGGGGEGGPTSGGGGGGGAGGVIALQAQSIIIAGDLFALGGGGGGGGNLTTKGSNGGEPTTASSAASGGPGAGGAGTGGSCTNLDGQAGAPAVQGGGGGGGSVGYIQTYGSSSTTGQVVPPAGH